MDKYSIVQSSPNDDTVSLCGINDVCGKENTPKAILPGKTKPLNGRQERFCIEYVRSNNATQSAINAGYKPEHAREKGYCLLKDPRISSYISIEKAKLKKELLKDRSTFLSEVSDLKQLLKEKGRFGEVVRLLDLEASILGLNKEQQAQQINVFGSLSKIEQLLEEKKEVINMS